MTEASALADQTLELRLRGLSPMPLVAVSALPLGLALALPQGTGAMVAVGMGAGLFAAGAILWMQRLLARLARRRAAQLFHSFAETDPDPVWMTDLAGAPVALNAAARAAFGDAPPEHVSGLLSALVANPEGTAFHILAAVERGRSSGETLRTAAGPLRLTARPAAGGMAVWQLGGADADPLDAADPPGDQARHSVPAADRFNLGFFENLPVPILTIAANGHVMTGNCMARQLLGFEEDEAPPLYDLLEGMGRPISEWLVDAANGRGLFKSEFVRAARRDRDLFLQISLGRVEGEGDPQLIGFLNDATELKTLEAQFVQSQKMQAIGQLAGGVAHDFNNLLTAISGHCDLLLLRHDEGDPDFSDLMQISHNANRAASLVGQLLAFSRKQNLKPQTLDLQDTMSDLTHLLNRLVGEKISLELRIDNIDRMIRADRRQFEQVVMNLVVNARDAMPEGGRIEIRVRSEVLSDGLRRDRALVPQGEYVVVEVADEGIGIEPDKISKIFEPFFTTKKTGEGTGLGLSTAYGIVKQTGGYIFAESEVGIGTTFTLYFPAHARETEERQVAEPRAARGTPPPGDAVILLVEDEAPVRAFAARALRLRGYTVLEAEDAEAALEVLRNPKLSVDVFVTDVIMPGLDGPSWVRQALESRPETRVVFVSGYAEEGLAENQARVPNSVFLPKPFSLNLLVGVVHDQLQSGRPGAVTLH